MADFRPRLGLALLASVWAGAAAAPAPDFAHNVAPILYRSCAPCHHAGGNGPFPLLSYTDAQKRAALIAAVTRSRYMPPWLPEEGYGDFEGDRRLPDDAIRVLAEWAAAGAPEGPPEAVPAPPRFTSDWQLGQPDLVLQAPAAFQVPTSGPDVYWNFVLRPNLPAVRFVRAMEIKPGDRQLIHHANMLVDRMAISSRKETAPGRGFPGMDLEVLRNPFDPPGHFMFWKPGSAPHEEPPGFAWRLDPGDELVLNVHMHPLGRPGEVRPVVGLYFTGQPPARFPLLVQLENDQALDIPPGARDFLVGDDFRMPLDADALAVYPHAHYLGKLLEAYATLPDGSRRWLIRIPGWNPDWQAVYYYRQPVFLPRGSVVSMRYHYDNSEANVRNPHHPPQRIRAGNQSTDEMAHLWLELLPRGPGDLRRELQEAVLRHRLEKDPGDFAANFNLGAVMLSRLDAPGAVRPLEVAVSANPRQPEARNMLGLALARVGRAAEAVAEFKTALALRPDYAAARFNLADSEIQAGQLDDAIRNLRQVVAENPADPLPRSRLEQALEAQRALGSGQR